MSNKYTNEYIFSGSLPENASTYVTREADEELYKALQENKFCYILNSRQSGKSSLRVRIMSRLSEAGVECASIDLSSVSIQSATQENWYADLIVKLIDSFDLNVDFEQWWEKNKINSPLMIFGDFLEKILLREVKENIVIFIDEIDSVLSLKFPNDDFFAFIRSCYNQRVDNAEYNRLTFCLLGVASPNNLIEDKQRTPFNIGKAISLKGFQLHEVKPLQVGLEGKFTNLQAVMEEILEWAGGQPFLTQKLCQFMLEESEQENPRSVSQVVQARIIEHWEFQDDPEHLRTIKNRILKDERSVSRLLGLYQRILQGEEVVDDDSSETIELRLSGLVVKQQGKLRVYNHIYVSVFNLSWVEQTLGNQRPYAEALAAWVASNCQDQSRLLRGQALQEALAWKSGKSLSLYDDQFLDTSQELDKREMQIALANKDKESRILSKANEILTQSQNRAKWYLLIGNSVLMICLILVAVILELVRNSISEVATNYTNEMVLRKSIEIQIYIERITSTLMSAGESSALMSGLPEKSQPFLYKLATRLPDKDSCVQLSTLKTNKIIANICKHPILLKKYIVDEHLVHWNKFKPDTAIFELRRIDKANSGAKTNFNLLISTPVYDNNGQLSYVLSAQSAFYPQDHQNLSSYTETLLIDQTGTILVHPKADRVGLNINGEAYHQEFIKPESNSPFLKKEDHDPIVSFIFEENGKKLLGTYTSIYNPFSLKKEKDWTILVIHRDNAIYIIEVLQNISNTVIIVLLITVVLWVGITEFPFHLINFFNKNK